MAESITNRIIARITNNLKSNAPDAGLSITAANVARSRRRPAEVGELPLISVRPLAEGVMKATPNVNCAAVLRTLEVAVTVRGLGEDAELDPIRNFAIESVMSDPTCGGLAIEVEETKHDWENDGAASESDYAEDIITFAVRYQTARRTAVSK
jgi:hypothetical protein